MLFIYDCWCWRYINYGIMHWMTLYIFILSSYCILIFYLYNYFHSYIYLFLLVCYSVVIFILDLIFIIYISCKILFYIYIRSIRWMQYFSFSRMFYVDWSTIYNYILLIGYISGYYLYSCIILPSMDLFLHFLYFYVLILII